MPVDDAEDGEVREVPEERRDEKRKHGSGEYERAPKKHKADKDRSRSREKVRSDRDRERAPKISYDQVSYSGDFGDRYDRYAYAADVRDPKPRKERGRDGRETERDDRTRRIEPEKDYNRDYDKDRERRREGEDVDRDRRREKEEKDVDRYRGRYEEEKDKDRNREKDRGKDKERNRDSKKDEERDHRRDDRSRDKNKPRDGSDRHDDRHEHRHRKDKDGNSVSNIKDGSTKKEEPPRTPRGDKDGNGLPNEGLLLEDDEDEMEKIRKQRAAILAKIMQKTGGSSSGPPAAKPPLQSAQASAQQTPDDDMFDDGKPSGSKNDRPQAKAGASEAADDVEDKDEIDTAHVFAAKELGGSDGDGEEDMFTSSPVRKGGTGAKPSGRGGDLDDERGGTEDVDRRLGDTNADNWDDAEGYFRTRPGELIIGRYLVNRDIGNGVYSTVLSAADQQSGREVAIKIVRSNETMTTSGKKEIEILKKLAAEDPEGKKHICELLSHFDYKNHLCMVFKPLEMNLRKLLKTYGREVGITLSAIRQYTRQLLIGLSHMIKCRVVHGDIKLDNIVITKDLKNVAICDFGTADWENECVITPYMVSRYYRPPEICLGIRYGYPMDLWSVGVCLFELYTGKFMFTGRNNNDMLKQFMDYKGAPSKKFLRKGQFFDQHFEEEKGQVVFKWLTQDKVTKAEIIEKKIYDKPVKSIYEQLRRVRSSSDDAKKIKEFSDLLEQIFIMDPTKRITVAEALRHPFLK